MKTTTKRLDEKVENPEPTEFEESPDVEVIPEKNNETDVVSEDFLGKPVVTIKKVLDKKAVISNRDVYTALVESNGEEIFVGIDPDYLSLNEIREGDIAVYNKPFLVKVVDSLAPLAKIPKVSFNITDAVKKDPTIQVVGGLEEQIAELREALEVFDPKKRKDMIKYGIIPVRGVLLYGPSGTGKTMLAKASANYVKVPFFYINTPELFKMHLGQTVQEIKRAFITARKSAPAIIYLDEVTRLAAKRSYNDGGAEKEVAGATEEFQAQMNGLYSNNATDDYIMVVGSTNLANVFDPAVLGRFDIHIKVPIPNFDAKKKIVEMKVLGLESKLSIDKIVRNLENINPNATGRDIENISNKAKRLAYRKGKPLSNGDFDLALKNYSNRVDVLLGRKNGLKYD